MSAQRKAKAARRAAEFKQKARELVYGTRTSAVLKAESAVMLSKIDIDNSVVKYRILLAAFVPRPCPR